MIRTPFEKSERHVEDTQEHQKSFGSLVCFVYPSTRVRCPDQYSLAHSLKDVESTAISNCLELRRRVSHLQERNELMLVAQSTESEL